MKIEASRSAFSSCNDRFMKNYKEDVPLKKQLEILQTIENVDAIPVTYERGVDPVQRKRMMAEYGIAPGTIVLPTYSEARIAGGTLSNRDPEIRREFTEKAKEAMDFCAEIGGVDVMLWLGHDGYDYPFEDNYNVRYGWLAENLHDIAAHRSDVKVTIEYKAADPRIAQYISSAPKALALCNEVDQPNMGVILDYGHALIAGENPAESAALLERYHRLFHIHLSDNYCKTDDDMMIGSVTVWRTLEFFWQLQEIGYDGYYVLDIWPPRMDGVAATKVSVKRTLAMWELAKSLPREKLRQLQAEGNVPAVYDMLTEHVLRI
ncbi:MAG: sugar phosphate isomerase/epimerase family protein [Oscillospiraceae bacterium]